MGRMGDNTLVDADEKIIDTVLSAATNVHRALGPGLYEKVYEAALLIELRRANLEYKSQVPVDASYLGEDLGLGFKADVIVENQLLLELKAVKAIDDNHIAQTITYLRLLKFKRGYILNFNEKLMKDGIKRISI